MKKINKIKEKILKYSDDYLFDWFMHMCVINMAKIEFCQIEKVQNKDY